MAQAGKGRFITLEGGEGAGKTTLSRALAEALRARGFEVIVTREPGGTKGADEVRALLVQGEGERWSPLSEALLLTAARNDHLERLIRPALARGAWVICDRYVDSTRAYQAAGRGLSDDVIGALTRMIGADRPDLTLILDIDPRAGVGRSRGGQAGEDRFEAMAETFHARVRESFLALAAEEPERCVLLDTSGDRAAVLAAALAAIQARLS